MKNFLSFKVLISLLIGLFLGAILTATILWHQIENRYKIGQKHGYLSGSFDMAEFLQKHLDGENVASYGIKYFSIKPIEIDNVRTFKIIGLEE